MWPKQKKFIFSQSWRLQVESKILAGKASSEATLLCPRMVFPPHLSVFSSPCLMGTTVILGESPSL